MNMLDQVPRAYDFTRLPHWPWWWNKKAPRVIILRIIILGVILRLIILGIIILAVITRGRCTQDAISRSFWLGVANLGVTPLGLILQQVHQASSFLLQDGFNWEVISWIYQVLCGLSLGLLSWSWVPSPHQRKIKAWRLMISPVLGRMSIYFEVSTSALLGSLPLLSRGLNLRLLDCYPLHNNLFRHLGLDQASYGPSWWRFTRSNKPRL